MTELDDELKPEILILGAGGHLGAELCRQLPEDKFFAKNHEVLDITKFGAVEILIKSLHPKIIINCAATSSFRRNEVHSREHLAVNSEAVANLAKACRIYGCNLIHISDAEVFGGSRLVPHSEYDCIAPLDVYALSKAAGEHAILAVNGLRDPGTELNYWIIRSSMICGRLSRPTGLYYLGGILHSSRIPVQIPENVYRSPLRAATLATEILWLAHNLTKVPSGIYHVASADHGNLLEIARQFAANLPDNRFDQIKPTVDNNVGSLGAFWPRNGALNTRAWCEVTGRTLPPWLAEIRAYAQDFKKHYNH